MAYLAVFFVGLVIGWCVALRWAARQIRQALPFFGDDMGWPALGWRR